MIHGKAYLPSLNTCDKNNPKKTLNHTLSCCIKICVYTYKIYISFHNKTQKNHRCIKRTIPFIRMAIDFNYAMDNLLHFLRLEIKGFDNWVPFLYIMHRF